MPLTVNHNVPSVKVAFTVKEPGESVLHHLFQQVAQAASFLIEPIAGVG
jgi:hypothetical protein